MSFLSEQVTRLKCGAFILALRLNHTVADAAGIVQFLNAMVELAHGAQTPSIQPVWERHLFNIPNSPRVTFEQREYDELDSIKDTITPLLEDIMVHKSFFFGMRAFLYTFSFAFLILYSLTSIRYLLLYSLSIKQLFILYSKYIRAEVIAE